MDERELSSVLEELAEETEVSPVPLSRITEPRRTWVPVAAAAAAVVLVGGVAGVVATRSGDSPAPGPAASGDPTSSAEPTATDPVLPAGARLVGVGHAAVVVPGGWGTNATECGTPVRDTVIVDEGPVCAMAVARPQGVEAIRVQPLEVITDLVGEATREGEVAGVPATIWETACARHVGGVRVCTAKSWLHGDADALFTAEAATAARAEELLSTIRITAGLTALPGPNFYSAMEGSAGDRGPSEAGQRYLDAVRAAGASLEVVTQPRPGVTPGMVLGVSPAPGTMLAPGDPVTVTVVAPQDSPAERVSVGVSWGEGGDETSYSDAEVRADPTLRIPVGTPFWAYYQESAPVRRGDVEERLTGDALARDHRNGPLWSYVAADPGRSTYTLTVRGRVIGMVTIIVVPG